VNLQSEIEEVIRFLVHRIDGTPELADQSEPERCGSQDPANEF
jgi:hypothetical protein